MVDDLVAMHLDHYKESGAELIMGAGRFIAAKTLETRGFMKALVEGRGDRILGSR
jgi:hypothetical protein